MIKLSGAGGLTELYLADFIHPQQPNYTTYASYTITHNQGKYPVLVKMLWFDGVYAHDAMTDGTQNYIYYDPGFNPSNYIIVYLTRFGGGGGAFNITPVIYFK